jgi:integrase
MRIIKYRNKYHAEWWEDDKQKRISLRTDDFSIAKRNFEALKRSRYENPETINDIADRWAEEKSELKGLREAKCKLKQICKQLGDLRPHQINRDVCKRYTEKRLEQGVVTTTIKNELVALRAAIRYFYPNTEAVFYIPPAAPPRDRYLTREEFNKLIEVIETPHVKLFTLIALYTAARSSAILELTWDRVDFERGLIKYSTGDHGNKGRAIVPISKKLLPYLEEAYQGRTCDHVIAFNDKPIKSIRWAFMRNAKKAGLKISPHVLRHTAAVWMAEAGISMSEIAQFLGHTNSIITERVYARYSPDYLRNAGDVL